MVLRDDALPLVTGTRDDSATALKKFPALSEFLETQYHLETVIENLALYRRVGS
ncbi:MAG: hypothetical protein U9R48_01735 [Chloroflexota bacterium]|nr:hypothetical protein [Chloroflexota bacterium]